MEDEFKTKERILITRDEFGNVLAVDNISTESQLDDNLTQKFLEGESKNEQVIICIFNS